MTLTAETVYWATQHGEIVRLEARTNACTTASVIGKGKVFPYSLPSVGPGADPGVQAVSPQVT